LNLFGAAAAATIYVSRDRVEDRVEAQRRPRGEPLSEVLAGMDPAVSERVRATLRASALAARPDFDEARQARREAIALTNGPDFDPADVRALLDRSRQAEIRGRARLEADAVALLDTLDLEDRKAVSRILTRKGRSGGRDGEKRPATAAPRTN
jgi:uncharacterized membrane protein